MPKMFVHTREGVLSADTRPRVAKALTELGMSCERLADSAKVRRGVWLFFTEHAPASLFEGGEIATDPIASVIVYALQGGLDGATRPRLIAGITSILGEHMALGAGPAPVYVAVHDIPESSWGMFGEQVALSALRSGS